jgi:peptidoglycan hydrolase CwlO-like protein
LKRAIYEFKVSLSEDERKQVLGEVLSDELMAITEYVKEVPYMKKKLDRLDEDIQQVKSDIKVLKVAITDTSREQKKHNSRITNIEAA